MITKHYTQTKSQKAAEVINNWKYWKEKFKSLIPPSEKEKVGLEEALEKATL